MAGINDCMVSFNKCERLSAKRMGKTVCSICTLGKEELFITIGLAANLWIYTNARTIDVK